MKTARPRSSRGRAADFPSTARGPLDLLVLLQVVAGFVLRVERSVGLLRLVADLHLREVQRDRVRRLNAAASAGIAPAGLIRRNQQIRERPGQEFLLFLAGLAAGQLR